MEPESLGYSTRIRRKGHEKWRILPPRQPSNQSQMGDEDVGGSSAACHLISAAEVVYEVGATCYGSGICKEDALHRDGVCICILYSHFHGLLVRYMTRTAEWVSGSRPQSLQTISGQIIILFRQSGISQCTSRYVQVGSTAMGDCPQIPW